MLTSPAIAKTMFYIPKRVFRLSAKLQHFPRL